MKRGTFEVKGINGKTADVEGFISDSGNFGVHRRLGSTRWQATHIASGAYIADGPTAREMKARVAEAEQMAGIDWSEKDPFATCSAAQLKAAVAAIFHRYPKGGIK